jgi:hypothetical protein
MPPPSRLPRRLGRGEHGWCWPTSPWSSAVPCSGSTRSRAARTTYSGTGYGASYAKGERADLGTRRVTDAGTRALANGG